MAVDIPVLERPTERFREVAVPSRMDVMAEDEHNARIRDTYQRLINPDNKIEDVLVRAEADVVAEPLDIVEVARVRRSITGGHPYVVENARADADIFRADSAINARREVAVQEQVQEVTASAPVYVEDETEDSLPTPTTIQYQTVGREQESKVVSKLASASDKKAFVFGKREKIIVAVFVAIVVALIALVIVNSTVIANLNADIANVQDSITTVRGAIAGVNSTFEEIIHNSISH